jgi:hypothetical protein
VLVASGAVPHDSVDRLVLPFSELAAALTFMASHRYFVRVADVAEQLPAPDADDGQASASEPSGPRFAHAT